MVNHSLVLACIEGSYIHKLWYLEYSPTGTKQIQSYSRERGGIYSPNQIITGNLEIMVSQPFIAGQSLFISPCAKHTVEASPEGQLITITIRNKQKRIHVAEVIPSFEHDRDFAIHDNQMVQIISDPIVIQTILHNFVQSLTKFQSNLIGEAIHPTIEKIHDNVKRDNT